MSDECAELRERLDSYLSDELLVESNHAIERHLARCSACAAELPRRRRLREELRQALADPAPVDALERRILDEIASGRATAWSRLARRRFLLAAAALAGVALVWWPRRQPAAPAPAASPLRTVPVVDQRLFDDTSRLHLECAIRRRLRTPPLDTVPRRLQAYAALWAAAEPELGEWTFVDAHVCPPRGVPDFPRQYGHVVLERAGHRLSLLATVDRSGELPPGDGLFERRGFRIVEAARGGFQLAALDEHASVSFVVSDLEPAAHRAVGARVLGRLAQALATGR